MSCSLRRSSRNKKPTRTDHMKDTDKSYVWKSVKGNPNLYCWMPMSVSKKHVRGWDLNEANIQDIPPPPIIEDIDDRIDEIVEEAENVRKRKLLKRIKNKIGSDIDVVSVDDPKKYKIIKNFIMEKGLKIYGGAALNAFLPKEHKIYNPNDIPDFDVYSPDPWNNAVELADEYYKKGYKYVETRAGIHKGTYKVYVDLWPVADISFMEKKNYDIIPTRTVGGLKFIYPIKVLENIYKEYSEPYSNPKRWAKVYKRERLFKKYVKIFPVRTACSVGLFSGGKTEINPTIANLVEKSYDFCKEKGLVFYGPIAYNTYIEIGGGSRRLLASYIEVLSITADTDIKDLLTKLLKIFPHLETETIHNVTKELNNTTYAMNVIIDGKKHVICRISQITMCTPINFIRGIKITSIDYLKYTILDQVTFSETKIERKDAICKFQYLDRIQNRLLQRS